MRRRIIDKRNKEKFMVDDLYLNGYAKMCGIYATGVYMILCRHASKDQECFPSKKRIAERLAISERSVYNAIQELKKHRIIDIIQERRREDGTYKSTIYILLDKSEWVKISVDNLPQAPHAIGTRCKNHRHEVPNKETHIRSYIKRDKIYKRKDVDNFVGEKRKLVKQLSLD